MDSMPNKPSKMKRSVGELEALAAKHTTHKPTLRRLKHARGEYVQQEKHAKPGKNDGMTAK